MYYLNSDKLAYAIKLLTSLEEITAESLLLLTKNVKLAEHYSIICLAYKTSLFKLASNVNGNFGDEVINVVPILAPKVSDVSADADVIDTTHLPVKEMGLYRPIIAPSIIERGHELYIPTACSIQAVLGYLQKDNDLRIKLFRKEYTGNLKNLGIDNPNDDYITEDNNTNIYLLGFKIVANNDIVAKVPLKQDIDDPAYYSKAEKGC